MAYQPKSYKKFVATAATATLVATAVAPTALAADFTDVNANYENAVSYLVDQGITKGLTETTFGVTQSIKRGDAAVMIAKALGLDTTSAPDQGFTDLNARVAGAVNAIVEAGIASGKTETTFAPDLYITRQETAKIIANAYGLTGSGETNFSDVNSNWAPFVSALEEAGIAQGLNETTFGATNDVTRGQFALFLYRAEGQPYEVATVESLTFNAEGDQFVLKFAEALPEDADLNYVLENYEVLVNGAAPSQATIDALKLSGTVSADRTTVTVSHTDLDDLAADLGGTSVTLSIGGKSDTHVFDVEAKVNSVTSLNAKQIQVTFNRPVDDSTVIADSLTGDVDGTLVNGVFNFTALKKADGTTNSLAVTADNATASLSADGKVLTISAAGSEYFDGNYTVSVNAGVETTDGEEVPAYSQLLFVDDNSGPVLVSGAASARTSTDTFVLTFDEPVSNTGAVAYINGNPATLTAGDQANQLKVVSSSLVAAGTTVEISVLNVRDAANNVLATNPSRVNVTVEANTAAPMVSGVTVSDENTIKVNFSKPMSQPSFTGQVVLVTGGVSPTSKTFSVDSISADGRTVTLSTSASGLYGSAESFTGTLVIGKDVTDTAGNKMGTDYSQSLTFNQDKVAPTVTSVTASADNKKVTVAFSENVDEVNALTTLSNISLINSTGTVVPFASGAAVTIVDNKLVIDNNNVALTPGSYTVRIGGNIVNDESLADNANAASIQTLTVGTPSTPSDTDKPVVTATTAPLSGYTSATTAPAAEQDYTFTVVDSGAGIDINSVLNLGNYTLDGKVLPAGTYITTSGYSASAPTGTVTVTLNMPSSSISTSNTNAQLVISNLRDLAGNVIVPQVVTGLAVAEGVRPTLSTVALATGDNTTLVATFSEAVRNVDLADFDVFVNDKNIANSELTFTAVTAGADRGSFYIQVAQSYDSVDQTVYIDVDGDGDYIAANDIALATGVTTAPTAVFANLSTVAVTGLDVELVAGTDILDTQGNAAVPTVKVVR